MSIRVGDVDVANEIIELHFQVRRTQLIIEALAAEDPVMASRIAAQIQEIDGKALEFVQAKFPNMGIQKK